MNRSLLLTKTCFTIMVLLLLCIVSCSKHFLKCRVDFVDIYLVPAHDHGYKHPIYIQPEIVSECLYKIAENHAIIFKQNKEVLGHIKNNPFFIFTDTLKKEKDSTIVIKNRADNTVHSTVDSSKIIKLSREISDALKTCTYKQEIYMAPENHRVPFSRIFSKNDTTIRFNYIWRVSPKQGFWMEFTRNKGNVVDEAGIGMVIKKFSPKIKGDRGKTRKRKRTIYPIEK